MPSWSPRPAPDLPDGLILFDGVCGLCSRWVRYVIARDAAARFRFLPIQSEAGRRLAGALGVSAEAPQTNVLILDGRAWFKSDSSLQVLARLSGTRWAGVLLRAPRWLRDPLYDLVACNRYRLFGRSDACMVPTPEQRARFLG